MATSAIVLLGFGDVAVFSFLRGERVVRVRAPSLLHCLHVHTFVSPPVRLCHSVELWVVQFLVVLCVVA